MSIKLKKLEIYIALSRYFDILKRLSLNHDCDGQTDRQTERPSAIARWRALTKWFNSPVAIAIMVMTNH